MLFALKALPATFSDVFGDDEDDDDNNDNINDDDDNDDNNDNNDDENDIDPKYSRHLITHNVRLLSIFFDNRRLW